jgi:hypothetical protein
VHHQQQQMHCHRLFHKVRHQVEGHIHSRLSTRGPQAEKWGQLIDILWQFIDSVTIMNRFICLSEDSWRKCH